jgi:16S rRNA pseudouridine516 synthase
MRLDKYLSHSGLGTRTETRKLIKQGVVEVNGEVCLDIGRHINHEDVRVFGDLIQYEEFLYYMMNKPKGVVSASKDPKQPTVVDLLQGDNPLFRACGRSLGQGYDRTLAFDQRRRFGS